MVSAGRVVAMEPPLIVQLCVEPLTASTEAPRPVAPVVTNAFPAPLPAVIEGVPGAATPVSTLVAQLALTLAWLVSVQLSVVFPLDPAVKVMPSPVTELVIDAPVPPIDQLCVMLETAGTVAALPLAPVVMLPFSPALILGAPGAA